MNEIIVQASHETRVCYGVAKCAEIVFECRKMVKGEGLLVLEERKQELSIRMKTECMTSVYHFGQFLLKQIEQ